ncbi:MAG: response regulator [Phycisphaerales bacterium]|nr:MAG: response regulator [Phycisphaerales bacterium]
MKRIIICDDEPHIVEGLRFLLRAPDRQLEATTSGKEALQRIEEQMPDLLITDIMMPEMSGLEVVATLRASPATKELPIVIITAKGQARDATMAQEVWGATVVAKPFEPQKLRQLISATLEKGVCQQPGSAC